MLIRDYLVETDIHPFVKGVTFEAVWANKVKAKVGGTFVWFAGLEDLIAMTEAAGRPKDREDLEFLRRLKRQERPGH